MSVIDWLLDADPAIRWQVLRDLTDASPSEVAAERARVATEGWGAQLLALQAPDGRWDGGTYRPGWVDDSKPFFDAWTATHFALQQLRDFGLDPASVEARRAIDLVRDNVRWRANGAPYFDGETEPCINGIALQSGAYFGQPVDRIVERLVGDELADGGWNCWAEYGARVSSFHSTICALEGLLEWQLAGGSSDAAARARERGEAYLLERGLFRRRSNGQVADPRFTMLSYPTRWYYDVLRGLDYFRAAGADPADPRFGGALELVASKRDERGRFPLENVHEGPTHLELDDGEGLPSRWVTVRALRVLRWGRPGALVGGAAALGGGAKVPPTHVPGLTRRLQMPDTIAETTDLLRRTPGVLRALLGHAPEAWVDTPDKDGGWRPRDVVGHLITGEQTNWIARARRILEDGTSRPFDPFDRFEMLERDRGTPLDELIDRFGELRAANLATLASMATDEDLARSGLHPALGEVTLGELLTTWAVHDLDHVAQVFAGMAGSHDAAVGPWKAYLGILLRRDDPAAVPG